MRYISYKCDYMIKVQVLWIMYMYVNYSDTVGSHEVHGNYDSIFTLCSESHQEAITSSWLVEPL